MLGCSLFFPILALLVPQPPRTVMKKPVLLSTLGAWLLACAVPLANANTADTVGKKIYETTCAACHANGVASAPKPGDAKAWAPLIEEGQDVLTAHAWVGVRAMPAQGGAPDLTLDDFAQAVAWMASASGGNWKAPDAAMMHRIRHEAAERLEQDIKAKKAMKKMLERD